MQISSAQRIRDSTPDTVSDGPQEWVLRGELLEDVPGIVHGAVVDDDYFVALRS